jgi:hypothetical protein
MGGVVSLTSFRVTSGERVGMNTSEKRSFLATYRESNTGSSAVQPIA